MDGDYVNLGVGMPTLIANYVVSDKEVIYHSENGLLGMGPPPKPGEEDLDLVNATKQFVTVLPGASCVDSADAFVMMRGGYLTRVFMGGFQVSENGDLANWATNDGSMMPSMGGAMDLAVGCQEIGILMKHQTHDGLPRILKKCNYPLTARGVVKRIYTDLAVINVTANGLVVKEIIAGLDLSALQKMTEASLSLAENWCLLEAPGL
jgi:3-oxoacid CoA-transferase B subunit